MKKTSVYLSDYEDALLSRIASEEGTSRAYVLREAIAAYEPRRPDTAGKREFASAGWFEGDGTSIVDVPEDEPMRGLGEQPTRGFGEQ